MLLHTCDQLGFLHDDDTGVLCAQAHLDSYQLVIINVWLAQCHSARFVGWLCTQAYSPGWHNSQSVMQSYSAVVLWTSHCICWQQAAPCQVMAMMLQVLLRHRQVMHKQVMRSTDMSSMCMPLLRMWISSSACATVAQSRPGHQEMKLYAVLAWLHVAEHVH